MLFLAGVAWSSLDTFDAASMGPGATPNGVDGTPSAGPGGGSSSSSSSGGNSGRTGGSSSAVAGAASESENTGAGGGGGAGGGSEGFVGPTRVVGSFGAVGSGLRAGGLGGMQGSAVGEEQGKKVMVRVHNDDIHTFEYVIATFSELGLVYQSVRGEVYGCGWVGGWTKMDG